MIFEMPAVGYIWELWCVTPGSLSACRETRLEYCHVDNTPTLSNVDNTPTIQSVQCWQHFYSTMLSIQKHITQCNTGHDVVCLLLCFFCIAMFVCITVFVCITLFVCITVFVYITVCLSVLLCLSVCLYCCPVSCLMAKVSTVVAANKSSRQFSPHTARPYFPLWHNLRILQK